MGRKETKQFDQCLAQRPTPKETVSREQKPKTGEINMQAAIQYVVNPPSKLPEGFKFGPVFV